MLAVTWTIQRLYFVHRIVHVAHPPMLPATDRPNGTFV